MRKFPARPRKFPARPRCPTCNDRQLYSNRTIATRSPIITFDEDSRSKFFEHIVKNETVRRNLRSTLLRRHRRLPGICADKFGNQRDTSHLSNSHTGHIERTFSFSGGTTSIEPGQRFQYMSAKSPAPNPSARQWRHPHPLSHPGRAAHPRRPLIASPGGWAPARR